jgi:hypothetical protein
MKSAITELDNALQGDMRSVKVPRRTSFVDFLLHDARVPVGGGEHGPYSFEGREVIEIIANHIDEVLGSHTGKPLQDSIANIAGGAQWGKTVLELWLAAYGTSQLFLSVGVFLPDDNLVQGIVDTKFRPDVMDQCGWFAEMTQVGKAVNKSGKATNRKGAFLVTDGVRKSSGLFMGLQKVPTTYTLDIAEKDELDDIPPKNEKFVKGRLTASSLRFQLNIGTQRVHGRGQYAKWKGSSQGVVLLPPFSIAYRIPAKSEVQSKPEDWINPEESFPEVIRMQRGTVPDPSDPKLTWAGDFRHTAGGEIVATHKPGTTYYLAHPETGEPLNRRHPVCLHRQPERLEQRDWSIRVSQLSIAAIGLSQIVGQFQLAVKDPDEMVVFRCDVLALPQSLSQALTPAVIERAKMVDPYELRIVREPTRAAFAGLDMGDKCYLTVREIENPARKRIIYATTIAAADVTKRMVALDAQNLWDALFIDQRPLVSESRSIALALNGLAEIPVWPAVPEGADQYLSIGKLRWDGNKSRWRGLRAAVVRFDKKKLGMGIEHGFDRYTEGGQNKFVPVILCNREETVDRVVRELLTPDEGVQEVLPKIGLRVLPSLLLPDGKAPVVVQLEEHFIAGSERERDEKSGELGDYVDGVANHFLFANGYSALAEIECEGNKAAPFVAQTVKINKRERSANRRVLA